MSVLPAEPVHLIEDTETGDRLLVYGTEKGVRVELKYEGDTLWMTQKQMSELFAVNIPTISRHLKNIFDEGELDPESVVSKNERTAPDGKTYVTLHYNLDAIISVAYRVYSRQGTRIRKWATEKLVQFATKGFVIDAERLKSPGGLDRLNELRDIIREIRSDEANLYAQVRHLFTLCKDYDPKSSIIAEFYARMQAKMVWAVTTHTPSELIISRANAEYPHMGLRSWKSDQIRQADAEVSKNYLIEQEIKELNRLTTIMLDVFEDGLDIGKISEMANIEAALDRQLRSLERPVLRDGGIVKTSAAKAHAREQYRLFDEKRRLAEKARADADLAALKAQGKTLLKGKKRGST